MWTWKPDELIKVVSTLTNHTDGLLLFAVKDSLRDKVYMHIGNDIVYIYGDTTIGGNLDVGSTGNSSIKIHGTGATTSYVEFKVSAGQSCVWDKTQVTVMCGQLQKSKVLNSWVLAHMTI